MKFLSVFFLVGLTLSYAVSVHETRELSVDEVQELDLLLADVLEEQRSSRDIKENLRNIFDRLMEKVADLTEKGKEVNGGLIDRVRNVLEKLKNKGIDLRDKIREKGGSLPDKAKDAWKKIMERLGIGEKDYAEGQRDSRDIKENLRNMFDRLMEKVADLTEKGKEVNGGLVDRVKKVIDKLKEKGIDLREKIREKGGSLPEKAKEAWNKFMERLGIGEKEFAEGLRDSRDIKENLKNMFDRLMEKVAEITEKGKEVNGGLVDRVKKVIEKLKEKGIDLREKIREKGGSLPEKAKEAWNKFMERLGIGEKEFAEGQRDGRDIKENLKNMFDRLMEKVAEITEKGKEVNGGLVDRVKKVIEKLKEKGIDLREKIREKGGSLPEKAKEAWNKFMERLGIGEKEFAEGQRDSRDIKENLKNMFDRLMEKVADLTEKGKEVNGGLVDRVKKIIEKLKEKGIDLREKIREKGGNLPEKAKEAWNKFMERLGIGGNEFAEGLRSSRDAKDTLTKMFDRLVEMVTDAADKGKEISDSLSERIKNLLERGKKLGVNLREKIKEKGESLSGKARELYNKFLEKIGIEGIGEEDVELAEGDDDDIQTELGRSLRDHLNGILQLIRESIERGKEVKDETLQKLKDIRQKMKDLRVELGARAKELLQKIREKGRNYWEKIKDIFGGKNRQESEADEDTKGRFGKILNKYIERLRKFLESGREIRQSLVDRVQDMLKKMKDIGMDQSAIDGKFTDLLGRLSEKGKEAMRKLMERLGIQRKERMIEYADDEDEDEEGGIKGRLGKILQQFLDKLKNVLEKNRGISQRIVDRIKDMIRKMKNVGMGDSDISGKFSDLFKKLTDKGKEALDKLMTRLGLKREERMIEFADDGDEDEDSGVKGRMGKILQQFLDKLKNVLEKNRAISQRIVDRMKDMIQKMKNIGMGESDISGKFSDLFKKLSDKGKEALDRLMTRLGLKREERMIEFADDGNEDKDEGDRENLVKKLERVLDRLKNHLEEKGGVHQMVVNRFKRMIQEMKNAGVSDSVIRGKFADLLKKMTSKGKVALEKLMTEIGLKNEGDEEEDERDQESLVKYFEEVLGRIKNHLEERGGVHQMVVNRLKKLIQKLKNKGVSDSDIRGKFSDLLEKMTDKGKEALEKLMTKLDLKKEERMIEFADEGENLDVSKDLKKTFEELIEKIKDALENGKSFRDGLEKLKEIRERLKELRVKLGDKAKDLVEKLREKIRDYFQKLMEKFNRREERSLKDVYENIKEYLKNLQIDLKEKFVKFGEWAKEKFEKGLERGRDRTETIKKLAREFIHDAKLLGKDTVLQAKYFFREYKEDLGELYVVVKEKIREKLESIEVYERVREYLRNLNIELREKFAKFGEWAKEKFERGLEQGKDRSENVKILARQFIGDAKVIGKDVAEQAKEFFREYKEDLGTIYDRVREKVREILDRQD